MKIRIKGISVPIDVNDIEDPNLLGESLRDLFFGTEKGRGCYENFEVEPGVEYLGEERDPTDYTDPEYAVVYKTYQFENIKMMYYWDGDGTLIFILGDRTLMNNDCKKNYIWDFV
jgi:hypothetical protein